jgi:hypothetical protein
MQRVKINIAYTQPGVTFLGRFMSRLRQSSSPELRELISNWHQVGLGDSGIAFERRALLVGAALRNVATRERDFRDAIASNEAGLRHCFESGGEWAFCLRPESVEQDLCLAVHALVYALRSCAELLDKFLAKFFLEAMGQGLTKSQLHRRARDHGVAVPWLLPVKTLRDRLTHEATPTLALALEPNTKETEILVLSAIPDPAGDRFPGETALATLIGYARDLPQTLGQVENWLLTEIEAVERGKVVQHP